MASFGIFHGNMSTLTNSNSLSVIFPSLNTRSLAFSSKLISFSKASKSSSPERIQESRKQVLQGFSTSVISNKHAGLSTVTGVEQEINGRVILTKISLLGVAEELAELMRKRVEITLISGDQVDEKTGYGKTYGKPGYVEWNPFEKAHDGETEYDIKFKWNSSLGVPGAFLIKNRHGQQFFLKELSIDIPGEGQLRFKCNSWINPVKEDGSERIFFSNKSYLPDETPAGLVKLRGRDLNELKGDGTGERHISDRIYDYDVYNDLGDIDKDPQLKRNILGGSKEFPYPRRCRTGRPPSKTDPKYESRGIPPLFVPPDERFPFSDFTDFGSNTIMAFVSTIVPTLESLFSKEFETFEEIEKLYEDGLQCEENSIKKAIIQSPLKLVQRFMDLLEDNPLIRFERPLIMSVNQLAWRTDREFARQTLAGTNPLVIQCLKEFPPSSKLDSREYGPQKSTITAAHIEKYLGGLSLHEALSEKRLFIVDYYDVFMPYVERINKLSDTANKTYATRSLFFLHKDGNLQPIAIELCLPSMDGKDAFRQVLTPAEQGTARGDLWLLAKAHFKSNDTGVHQLVSHWLTTHAVVEPFIIATHRQLSRMHPLYKLLVPHYLNTMDINQAARQFLVNADGIIEQNFTPGKYSIEMSSKAYKQWKFTEQALPADLLKRGMAVEDPAAPHGLRLAIEDYPYAVDGLEIWSALNQWVSDYIDIYYKNDSEVRKDEELQAWWDEIVTVGHGDHKDEPDAFYTMDSKANLVEACTTLIWTTSGHHSAVNFGQYPLGGYMPNMPTMTRKLLPAQGSPEFKEMLQDVDAYFLRTVSSQSSAVLITSVLEILSSHAKNEVYIGQIEGSTPEWADDMRVLEAFNKLSTELVEVEKNVILRNEDRNLHHRRGPADVPYQLLYPNTTDLSREGGVTGRGVPNSISI